MNGPDPFDHAWWLTSRAAGIIALLAVTASVLIGLLMASRFLNRPALNRTLMSVHEHAALAGLIAIGVHGVTLLGDPWLNPGITGVLVPFKMDYRPLYSGLGIIAGFMALVLGLSFYARKHVGVKLWRKLHRMTLAVYVLGVVHTLGAGTDASTVWMRGMLLATGAPILFLALVRLLPRGQASPAAAVSRSEARPPSQETRRPVADRSAGRGLRAGSPAPSRRA